MLIAFLGSILLTNEHIIVCLNTTKRRGGARLASERYQIMDAEATLQWTVLIAFVSYYVSAFYTDPPAVNGGTVDLPAVENAANVPVFCAVTFDNTPVSTIWYLKNGTMPRERIFFGQPQFPNFVGVPGTPTVLSNITIVSFSRANLDMVLLECSNGFPFQLQHAFFTPRFIG